ncbi:hypothetical protein GCM10027614_30430 [Micromonospora vulcania]
MEPQRRELMAKSPGPAKRQVLQSIVYTILASLVLVISGTGPATAAPAQRPAFADQAQRAGLSSAQSRQLQAEVDSYLAKLGGNQVAANEISLGQGARILVALPGERKARSLTSALREPNGCPYQYLCAYQYQNFEGSAYHVTKCGSTNAPYIPWSGYGSWRNNQTSGTRPVFWRCSGYLDWMPPAYSSNSSYDWTPICYTQAC